MDKQRVGQEFLLKGMMLHPLVLSRGEQESLCLLLFEGKVKTYYVIVLY